MFVKDWGESVQYRSSKMADEIPAYGDSAGHFDSTKDL